MRTLIALAVLCVPAIAAPVPKELRKSPLNQFEGKWQQISAGMEEIDDGPTWTIQGDKATITKSGNNNREVFALEYNITSVPYKIMAIEKTGRQKKALVRVDGERRHECICGVEVAEYPADFDSPGCIINIYKRVPDKTK